MSLRPGAAKHLQCWARILFYSINIKTIIFNIIHFESNFSLGISITSWPCQQLWQIHKLHAILENATHRCAHYSSPEQKEQHILGVVLLRQRDRSKEHSGSKHQHRWELRNLI